jgi:hypothetical protein
MTLPEAVSNRLIGALFVERGLVSQSQLVVALELQQETGQQLGQILVERFGVERAELAKVVAEHWARMGEAKEEAGTRASESWRQLGEILVTRGFVTREQLVQALERQRLTGERLGEALVGQGVISKFELAGSLAEQASLVVEAPEEAESKPADVVEFVPRLEAALSEEPGPGLVSVSALSPEPAYGTEASDSDDAPRPSAAEPESEAEPQHPREPRPAVELILESVAGKPADTEPEPVADVGLAPLHEVPVEPDPPHEPAYVEHVGAAEPELEVGLVAHHNESPASATALCVAFASTPRGYRLVELENGLVPEVGKRVEVPDVGELVVLRHGPSPLPSDDRVCVFLEPLVPVGVPA